MAAIDEFYSNAIYNYFKDDLFLNPTSHLSKIVKYDPKKEIIESNDRNFPLRLKLFALHTAILKMGLPDAIRHIKELLTFLESQPTDLWMTHFCIVSKQILEYLEKIYLGMVAQKLGVLVKAHSGNKIDIIRYFNTNIDAIASLNIDQKQYIEEFNSILKKYQQITLEDNPYLTSKEFAYLNKIVQRIQKEKDKTEISLDYHMFDSLKKMLQNQIVDDYSSSIRIINPKGHWISIIKLTITEKETDQLENQIINYKETYNSFKKNISKHCSHRNAVDAIKLLENIKAENPNTQMFIKESIQILKNLTYDLSISSAKTF